MGRRKGRFRSLPLAAGWTDWRDMPAPEGKTFHQLWAERQAKVAAGPTTAASTSSDRKAA
jgi:L-lactate dehydrogenase complex protein LldF